MIAQVAVDVPLPHLDRFFDYELPEKWAAEAVIGARVRVRFAGRMVDGLIVGLGGEAQPGVSLKPIEKLTSAEPIVNQSQLQLFRAVADHFAGNFYDVVRLAVPPRHATTEKAPQRQWPAPNLTHLPQGGLLAEPQGESFLHALQQGRAPRAHWLVPAAFNPTATWLVGFAQAAISTLQSGKSVLLLAPDLSEANRLRDALAELVGMGAIAELNADLGQSARYRNYLAISRGQARIVVGTRAAIYAPLTDLGLIALWDDGDDLYAEQRAPYPHARAVAAIRANLAHCGLLFASYSRTAEIQAWLARDWLAAIERPSVELRKIAPLVRAAADSDQALERDPHAEYSRLPKAAFETIRNGLAAGPVLVQTPRAGYLPALSCARCRTQVRCPQCNGPVSMTGSSGHKQMACTWCGRLVTDWRCQICGGRELRAGVIGAQRTAEELGRAFPNHRVIASSGQRRVPEVAEQPALVIATPGAEPVPSHGYAAAVLLDASKLLARPDLRASEEALRRWLQVVALVRGGNDGGTVCIVGPAGERTVQALIRMDPAGFAERELADRAAALFPPAIKMVAVTGEDADVHDFASSFHAASGADAGFEVLGPVEQRLILRSPLSVATALTSTVKATAAARSARKLPAVKISVDPQEL